MGWDSGEGARAVLGGDRQLRDDGIMLRRCNDVGLDEELEVLWVHQGRSAESGMRRYTFLMSPSDLFTMAFLKLSVMLKMNTVLYCQRIGSWGTGSEGTYL